MSWDKLLHSCGATVRASGDVIWHALVEQLRNVCWSSDPRLSLHCTFMPSVDGLPCGVLINLNGRAQYLPKMIPIEGCFCKFLDLSVGAAGHKASSGGDNPTKVIGVPQTPLTTW